MYPDPQNKHFLINFSSRISYCLTIEAKYIENIHMDLCSYRERDSKCLYLFIIFMFIHRAIRETKLWAKGVAEHFILLEQVG